MNSYLSIASKVLGETKQALSARQILNAAYQLQIVPPDLYGKTQHKTLHARLAEDILRRRNRSEFVRTAPGRFLLRKYLADKSVHSRFKREYRAPNRLEQLKRFHVLCVSRSEIICNQHQDGRYFSIDTIAGLNPSYDLLSLAEIDEDKLVVRVCVILRRDRQILLHRSAAPFGDSLEGSASLGLLGYVKRDDQTLFAGDKFGVHEAAERTLYEKSRLPVAVLADLCRDYIANNCIVNLDDPSTNRAVLAVVSYSLPADDTVDELISPTEGAAWYTEPIQLNDMAQLEPWSRFLIESQALGEILPKRIDA